MFCYKCGTRITDGDKFCAGCGAPQQSVQDQYQPPEQAYIPLEQTYIQPQQAYAPPEQAYTPPEQASTPPEQAYTPPEQAYVAPEQAYIQPEQVYAPPGQVFSPYGSANPSPEPMQWAPQQDYARQSEPYTRADSVYPAQENVYAQTTNAYAAPQYNGAQQTDINARQTKSKKAGATGKSGLWWKVAVPVVILAIAAAAVYYFFFLNKSSSIVGRAFSNMQEEMAQRLDSTPLKAVGMLSEAMQDGTVTIDFNYENRRYGDEASGSVAFSSVAKDREFALGGDVTVYGETVDFEAFINKERIAIGSSLIDNNYYGFKYSTFRDDIRGFGNMVGLDRATMDQLADVVEMLEEALNQDTSKNNSGANSEYTKILSEFIGKCEQTSERVDVDSGGQTVKATKVEINITKDAILSLLDDLYDALDNDDSLREQFSSLKQYVSTLNYSQVLREFRSFINDFDKYYSDSSTITITMFIGNGDRLMRVELNTNLRIDGERIRFSGSIDFGASATDRWVIRLDANGETIRINWDYKERSSKFENTITITADGDTFTLTSEWSPERGNFTLSFDNGYGYTGELTGNFRVNSKGFTLSFDNLMNENYGEYLTIEIKAETGANIKKIDYINIDEWGKTLINKIEEMFTGLGGY